MEFSSRIPGFYNKSIEERREILSKLLTLDNNEISILKGKGASEEVLNIMTENVVGSLSLPFSIATNFIINEKEYLIPMVIEESSVVAAASHAAKMTRQTNGFSCEYTGSFTIGQIQILDISNFEQAESIISKNKQVLLDLANSTNKILVELGGGAKDLEFRRVRGKLGEYLVLHLIVDVKDAMGANAVNTMLEKLQPRIEELTRGKVLLKILSNFADKRIVKVRAVFDKNELGGEKIVDNILLAYDFADHDPYRCTTHNKGIMNGIISVLLATGNDTRAVEAGAHAYASKDGRYRSLTRYEKDEQGNLVGYLEMPVSVGILGGAIGVHPGYKLALKILGVSTAAELSCVIGAVGLAQNLAALRALSNEGIQKGHMFLHARNIAVTAGATGTQIEEIAKKLIQEDDISFDAARRLMDNTK